MDRPLHPNSPAAAVSTPLPDAPVAFGKVIGLGQKALRSGTVVGLVGALLSHAGLGAEAYQMSESASIRSFAAAVQVNLQERLKRTMDLDLEEPLPEPPPEPEPEPEPPPEPEPVKPVVPPPAVKAPPQPVEPPPPAAQAGKVLTAEPDPAEPLDLTGNTFVTGNGDRYVGGITAAGGTGQKPTYNKGASVAGVEGGKGTAPVAEPAYQGPDLSRAVKVTGSRLRNCGFPPEADVAQINYMTLTIMVTVDPSGKATSVSAMSDPGYGFVERARRCALAEAYEGALNKAGKPIPSTIKFTVRFTRN
jgi:periplasmic protein TonB